jgi:hypothetical protein
MAREHELQVFFSVKSARYGPLFVAGTQNKIGTFW